MATSSTTIPTKIVILVVIIVAFIAGFVTARTRYKPQIYDLSQKVIERDEKISALNSLRSRIVFRDGELSQVKDGEHMVLEEEVLLSDGTRVTLDGEVVYPNGEQAQLESGDSVLMDGMIVKEGKMQELMSEMNNDE